MLTRPSAPSLASGPSWDSPPMPMADESNLVWPAGRGGKWGRGRSTAGKSAMTKFRRHGRRETAGEAVRRPPPRVSVAPAEVSGRERDDRRSPRVQSVRLVDCAACVDVARGLLADFHLEPVHPQRPPSASLTSLGSESLGSERREGIPRSGSGRNSWHGRARAFSPAFRAARGREHSS